MGLSVAATYGILFTASLFMLSILLNGLLYSYDQFKSGVDNKISMIENKDNLIKVDRVVMNATHIEIYAINEGPNTLNASQISLIINGTIVNFTSKYEVWYPNEENVLYVNNTWDLGSVHELQFTAFPGGNPIATAEYDKIYTLNSTGVYAFWYSGALGWSRSINGPRDIAVSSSSLYILNTTGIIIMTHDDDITSFFPLYNYTAIAARGPTIYAVNQTTLSIINTTTGAIDNVSINNGKDVAVGKYVFVLENNVIRYYTYSGTYVGSISTGLIAPRKITASPLQSRDYLLVLNGNGNILLYRNENLKEEISPGIAANNIDLYGKIYLSGTSVYSYDGGYRIKIVDSFGNQIYTML